MSIAMNWGSVLGQGVLGGIAGYANAEADQAKEARANDEREKLQKEREDSEKAIETFKQAIAKPVREAVPDTDENGKPVMRTVQSKFVPDANNPAGGSWVDTNLGTQAVPAKPREVRNVIMGENEATQEFDPQAGTWNTVGAPGPRWAKQIDPGAGAAAADARMNARLDAQEARAAAAEDAKNRRESLALANRDYNSFQSSLIDPIEGKPLPNADAIKAAKYKAAGINPLDYNADEQYKASLTNEHLGMLGSPTVAPPAAKSVFSTTQAGADTNAPPAMAGPPVQGSQTNPPAKAPYPDGTKVKGPDGRLYVIQNGQPVLAQ